jgi:hypothetical protein
LVVRWDGSKSKGREKEGSVVDFLSLVISIDDADEDQK